MMFDTGAKLIGLAFLFLLVVGAAALFFGIFLGWWDEREHYRRQSLREYPMFRLPSFTRDSKLGIHRTRGDWMTQVVSGAAKGRASRLGGDFIVMDQTDITISYEGTVIHLPRMLVVDLLAAQNIATLIQTNRPLKPYVIEE